jgi:CHAT domain-containing protein
MGTLPYALEECDYLKKILNATLFKSAEATVDNFRKELQNYNILHLATHACVNSDDPLLSEIHFSDNYITVYDIVNLNIQPDLVVLSACNSAQGEHVEGEGIIGLTRGFIEAGVRSLQSSLWSIDDYSSSKIMQKMYDYLKKSESRPNALRLAKLDYINSSDKLRSHPYFWAGMIHIGDHTPLFPKPRYNIWLTAFVGIISLLSILYFRKRKRRIS